MLLYLQYPSCTDSPIYYPPPSGPFITEHHDANLHRYHIPPKPQTNVTKYVQRINARQACQTNIDMISNVGKEEKNRKPQGKSRYPAIHSSAAVPNHSSLRFGYHASFPFLIPSVIRAVCKVVKHRNGDQKRNHKQNSVSIFTGKRQRYRQRRGSRTQERR